MRNVVDFEDFFFRFRELLRMWRNFADFARFSGFWALVWTKNSSAPSAKTFLWHLYAKFGRVYKLSGFCGILRNLVVFANFYGFCDVAKFGKFYGISWILRTFADFARFSGFCEIVRNLADFVKFCGL